MPDLAQITGALAAEAHAQPSPTDERIIDGALAEVAAHGIKHATVDGIAARAGVGRVTVFRRFGSKDALIERLTARELRRFLIEIDTTLRQFEDPEDQVVEAFAACLRAGREHPFVARVVRTEPGAALEQLAAGSPSPIDVGRAFVSGWISSRGGRGRVVRNADQIADALVRMAAFYVLFPPATIDSRDEDAVRDFARTALAPLVRD